jgi:hypothetical protein
VTTVDGVTARGRYLGIEVEHDEWAILLAEPGATHSIAIDRLTGISDVA